MNICCCFSRDKTVKPTTMTRHQAEVYVNGLLARSTLFHAVLVYLTGIAALLIFSDRGGAIEFTVAGLLAFGAGCAIALFRAT
jgi:hypothetical protein